MLADKTIKKHVAIIHAYSLMSSLQRKILNVLLYEALQRMPLKKDSDSVVIECRIPFNHVAKSVDFNSHNTQYLKEALDGLASLKIEWNLLKDKAPLNVRFLNLRVLHGPPTFYQDGSLNFSFHKLMLDLVDNPAVYGIIDLELQRKFDSKYGHSLYENSTRFLNLYKSKIIPLAVFRKLLGVQENVYACMREFNRNVLLPSIEEVNDRANFTVNLSNIKSGRKISGFEIVVTNKKKLEVKTSILTISDKLTQEIQTLFGGHALKSLEPLFKEYPESYISEKVEYTKKNAKKNTLGFLPIPYLVSAIKNDYKISINPPSSVQEVIPVDTWKLTFKQLELDLNHWKKMLSYAKASQHIEQIKNIEVIILNCEAKLNKHKLLKVGER
jgi:hypothetical protein